MGGKTDEIGWDAERHPKQSRPYDELHADSSAVN
jgi:hypothetical protein